MLVDAVITVHREAELLEIVDALGACSRLTHLLHGRHQQRDQDRNDGDDDEQFDQGEALSFGTERYGSWRLQITDGKG